MSVRVSLVQENNFLLNAAMNTKEAKEGLIYLYCISNKVPKLKGLEDLCDKLSCVYHKKFYAVVSKVKKSEFSEENLKRNLVDLEWIKAKVTIHEKVIEGIMKNTCVIPFKFATLFNTEDNLKTMLEEHLEEFKDILRKLENKEEWGVKIYCNSEKLKKNLMQEDEQLLNIDKGINSSSTGKAYFLKKKKENLLNILANKKLNEYGQISFDRLREKSTDARINKLLPKEVTEKKDEMILNSAFLINKDKVENFLKIVEELRTKYTDKEIFFDCTGPWPPYNFCSPLKEKDTWIDQ